MEIIKYPKNIDYKRFNKNKKNLKSLFGLPNEVKFCKICVISNQRPNSAIEYENKPNSLKKTINFNEDGICDACKFAEKKRNIIDWNIKENELLELCNRFRRDDGRYDCILPGSGGKDSVYASHILKFKYKMNPLTVTWSPHIYTDWGWKNFRSWIDSGFDNYLMTPNGKIHRILTRLSLELLLHPFQPFMLGQKSLPQKLALLFDIPLVFYGENEAEYGNPIRNTETSKINNIFISKSGNEEINISGLSIEKLKKYFGLNDNDLLPYLPADREKLINNGVEVHYLGYYLKWHPQSAYYYAVENCGFEASPERTPGTYSKYSSIDDKIDDLHYYTTGAKFGIGRASYDAAQEIRSDDIDRNEGISLVKRFDHEFPSRFIDELMDYLSLPQKDFPTASKMFEQPIMDKEYFKLLIDNFRSEHLWYFENNNWFLRKPVWEK